MSLNRTGTRAHLRRWAIVLRLYLSALWTFQVIHTDLDRQCIHSWRISQSYINVTRNTFNSKTSRGWNGPGVSIKGNKPKRKIIWLKTLSWESNPDHEYGRYKNSKIYLRKISHNCILVVFDFPPSFWPQFFFCFFRTGVFVARHLRHLLVSGFVKNTLNTVINISRITFKVLTFRVIVKEALLKILLPIQRRQCWQKWTLFISYRDNFRPTPFCALEEKYPCVSHEMAQFV